MSRQFDEYMSGKFEMNGELYELIEPRDIEEAIQALEMKSMLETYVSGLMHDDDSADGYLSLLQEQEDYIQEYINSLGEYDNSHLMSNINYFLKKYELKMGELEQLIGVSAGYISRTAKENSAKKLSIDVVWKLARLFDIDVTSLVDTDVVMRNNNTEILTKFIEKLKVQTEKREIEWLLHGGVMGALEKRYSDMGLVTANGEKEVYHPDHLNNEYTWLLSEDIVTFEHFNKEKDLVIIPYKADGEELLAGYDFIFVWQEKGEYHWEKAFYTADDAYGILKTKAAELYEEIQDTEFDAQMTPQVRSIIAGYVYK